MQHSTNGKASQAQNRIYVGNPLQLVLHQVELMSCATWQEKPVKSLRAADQLQHMYIVHCLMSGCHTKSKRQCSELPYVSISMPWIHVNHYILFRAVHLLQHRHISVRPGLLSQSRWDNNEA